MAFIRNLGCTNLSARSGKVIMNAVEMYNDDNVVNARSAEI